MTEQPIETTKTEAPTNQATHDALNKSTGLNEEQQDFVTLMCQIYGVTGKLPTVELAVSDYMFEEDEFLNLMDDDFVRAALKERGVGVKPKLVVVPTPVGKSPELVEVPETWRDKALTPIQIIVANTMLDLIDTRSQKKKLQDLGIRTSQYNMWLKNENFSAYLRERAESMLGENQHEAHLALLDKVRMGDIKAITYYNEMTGRYVQERSSSNGSSNFDFRALLVRILEIINDEVHDPQTAINIAERFKSLMTAQTVAQQLIGGDEPIEQPTISPTRELTPRLKELMDKGEGYE